jgi:hypothetical protein
LEDARQISLSRNGYCPALVVPPYLGHIRLFLNTTGTVADVHAHRVSNRLPTDLSFFFSFFFPNQLKRVFALCIITWVTTVANAIFSYSAMDLSLKILHWSCLLAQFFALAALRNATTVELASWLVLLSVAISTLICGYIEGPVGLGFRSIATVVIGRATQGSFCFQRQGRHGILSLLIGIRGTLVCGLGSAVAILISKALQGTEPEELLGVYRNGDFHIAVFLVILWGTLWTGVVSEGEEHITARLRGESEHKNVFMAKVSHELRYAEGVNTLGGLSV